MMAVCSCVNFFLKVFRAYLLFCFSPYQETPWYEETTVELMAPTMLPELQLLKKVEGNVVLCAA
jgi:hypothetical protein